MSECSNLEPISQEGFNAFTLVRDMIVMSATTEAVSLHIQDETFTEKESDEIAIKIKTGFSFVTQILESVLVVGSEKLLAKELEWAAVRLPHEGFTAKRILRDLEIYRKTVQETVDCKYIDEILPYLDFMIEEQQQIVNGQERCNN